ncbi:MAG: DUF6585 family protein [Chloroflexota bacterium]
MDENQIKLPDQFSTITKLGKPIEIFQAKSYLILQIILAFLFLVISGGLFVYSTYLGFDLWNKQYYPPIIIKTLLPWFLGLIAAVVITVLIGWQIYSSRKKAAVVYKNGFAYSDFRGVKSCPWDQIKSVTAKVVRNYTYGIYIGTAHTYTLINLNDEKLTINDSLSKVERFYDLLQNKSLQSRYQRSADQYNLGKQVNFGPISISKGQGLLIGKKSYPWDGIAEVSIHQGMLSIKKKDGGWFSGATASSSAIPNLHVLLSIIDQIVGIQTGS